LLADASALAFRTHRIDSAMARNTDQPGRKSGTLRLVTARRMPDILKHILHDFFRRLSVTGDTERDGVDQGTIAVVDHTERRLVTLNDKGEQRLVAQSGQIFTLP
jgi:hypothetical protein